MASSEYDIAAAIRGPGCGSPRTMTGVGTTIAGALSQIADGIFRMKSALVDEDESCHVATAS